MHKWSMPQYWTRIDYVGTKSLWGGHTIMPDVADQWCQHEGSTQALKGEESRIPALSPVSAGWTWAKHTRFSGITVFVYKTGRTLPTELLGSSGDLGFKFWKILSSLSPRRGSAAYFAVNVAKNACSKLRNFSVYLSFWFNHCSFYFKR